MLEELSRRTTEALRLRLPLRLALPYIESFLALNLSKEVAKDTLVIRRASECVRTGAPPGHTVALELLGESKEVDRRFLDRVRGLPVRVTIPYERVGPLRLARIERSLDLSYHILESWQRKSSLRVAVRDAYTQEQFEHHLLAILDLYARETQAVGFSVLLPLFLAPVQQAFGLALKNLMVSASQGLVREIGGALYRRGVP